MYITLKKLYKINITILGSFLKKITFLKDLKKLQSLFIAKKLIFPITLKQEN